MRFGSVRSLTVLMTITLVLGMMPMGGPALGDGSRGPDIIVGNITFSDNTPSMGDNVTMHVEVGNNGNFPAVDVSVRVSAENASDPGSPYNVGVIKMGSTNGGTDIGPTGWQTADVPIDSALLGLLADFEYLIRINASNGTDDDYANGHAQTNLTFYGPDLRITGWGNDGVYGADVQVLLPWEFINITVTVENVGIGDAVNESVDLLMKDSHNNTVVDHTWYATVAASSSIDLRWELSAAAYQFDNYTFSAEVVSNGNTSEYSDVIFSIVEPYPWLQLGAHYWTPSTPYVTDVVTIYFELENSASEGYAAGENVDIDVLLDNATELGSFFYTEVELGDVLYHNVTWDTTGYAEGDHNITFRWGADNWDTTRVDETIVLGAERVPNLYFVEIDVTTTPKALDAPGDFQLIPVEVVVRNNGTKDLVNGTVTLTVEGVDYTDDTVNVTTSNPTVVEFMVNLTTEEDDYNVTLEASAPGFPAANASAEVTVPGDIEAANVVLNDISYGETVQQMGVFPIIVTLKNLGDANYTGLLTVTLFSNGGNIGELSFSDIMAGGSNSSTYEWTPDKRFPAGTHRINATLGSASLLGDEFTVTEFKIPVLEIEFVKNTNGKVKDYKATGEEGKKKRFTVELMVSNTGSADAGYVFIKLMDRKGNELGNASLAGLAVNTTKKVTIEFEMKAGKSTGDMVGYASCMYNDFPVTAVTSEPAVAKFELVPGLGAVAAAAAILTVAIVLGRRRRAEGK